MKFEFNLTLFSDCTMDVALEDINKSFNTNGKGYWSNSSKSVLVTDLEFLTNIDSYTELQIFFDKNSWDNTKDGLIYTDPLFLEEFHTFLIEDLGISSNIELPQYSEHGMQGDNYISMDMSHECVEEIFRVSDNPKRLFYISLINVFRNLLYGEHYV